MNYYERIDPIGESAFLTPECLECGEDIKSGTHCKECEQWLELERKKRLAHNKAMQLKNLFDTTDNVYAINRINELIKLIKDI